LKALSTLLIVWLLIIGSALGQEGENIANAFILTGPLPIAASGTTDGYLDDYDEACPYAGSASPDVVYAYTPASTVTVNIDLCGSSYDTKVFIYENTVTPGAPFECNDDFYVDEDCGLYVSKIEGAVLVAGNTYYIVIDGYGDDYGEYALTISESNPFPPCDWGLDVICPDGAFAENEVCGENTNGGCNMAPGTENLEFVAPSGSAFCGTTWANGGIRDTDWYELVLTVPSAVILTADADREIFYGLLESESPGAPDCASVTGVVAPGNFAGPCNETYLDLGILGPGTYWFVVRMDVLYGYPCDNHYRIDFGVVPESCPPPETLSASMITTATASLSWSEPGEATTWEYQIGLEGYTPAATGTPTGVNPLMVVGLSANTSYDFYVRAVCGDGFFSDWSGPAGFVTPCEPVATIPWSENFDAMGNVGNDILPDCWAAESFTGTPWTSGNAASNPYNDPCSAPNYMFVDFSPYPTDKYLITPGFTLTAGTSYDLSFSWAGDGFGGWNGDVMVNTYQTGMGAVVLGAPFVTAETITSAACSPVNRSFVPTTTGTYYFIVRVSNNIAPQYLGFDDFMLDLSPACSAPIDLQAVNITQTGATLAWTPGGAETAWEFVYGESPLLSPPGPGSATTSNTLNQLSGLTSNTLYQYYARANCDGEFSAWAGPHSFSTLCDEISSFPWAESFEDTWPPLCWTDAATGDYGWDKSTFGGPSSGTEWAYCNLAGSALSTPVFTLSDDSRLVFSYRVEDEEYPMDLTVKAGNDVIYEIIGATNETYREIQLSLAAFTGQSLVVTFLAGTGTGGADFGICLDDVAVSLINNWTGNISTAWNNQGNWSLGLIPGPSDMVFIPSVPPGGNFPVVLTGISATCYRITLSPGASLKIENGGTLQVLNP
jgi:hypothetical protein